MLPPILDACCGSRMFYTDKYNEMVLFVDNRKLYEELETGHIIDVDPDIVADFRYLTYDDETFYHVVFDPPHLIRAGENSWLAKKYGRLPSEGWEDYIDQGFSECMRVLKLYGTLVFKWNEDQIKTKDVIEAIGEKPLYLQKRAKTHWMVFIKTEE